MKKSRNIIFKSSILISVFVFSAMFKLYAQDIHFSQYYSSPLNLNPAKTGFLNASNRLVINNKNQWGAITVPYTTISASFDMQLFKRKFRGDMFGLGVVFNSDKAGDSEFSTTQGNLSLSYIKSLSNRNNHFISFGIQAGVAQRTINYSELVFDNQYNGNSFDPNLYTGEHFTNNNFLFYDLSAGVHWYYKLNHSTSFNGGFSAFHLNKPKQSLFDNEDVVLNQKFIIYGDCQFEVSNKTDLVPGVIFTKQGPYSEILFGSLIKFERNSNPDNYSAINFGIYSRLVDAAVVIVGIERKKLSFGISYDVNYSKLQPASNSRGGLELSLTYVFSKSKSNKIKAVPCPIF